MDGAPWPPAMVPDCAPRSAGCGVAPAPSTATIPTQQAAEQVGAGDDPFLLPPDRDQVVVYDVVVGVLGHDFHVPDDIAKFSLHVAHDDGPMPIEFSWD